MVFYGLIAPHLNVSTLSLLFYKNKETKLCVHKVEHFTAGIPIVIALVTSNYVINKKHTKDHLKKSNTLSVCLKQNTLT